MARRPFPCDIYFLQGVRSQPKTPPNNINQTTTGAKSCFLNFDPTHDHGDKLQAAAIRHHILTAVQPKVPTPNTPDLVNNSI